MIDTPLEHAAKADDDSSSSDSKKKKKKKDDNEEESSPTETETAFPTESPIETPTPTETSAIGSGDLANAGTSSDTPSSGMSNSALIAIICVAALIVVIIPIAYIVRKKKLNPSKHFRSRLESIDEYEEPFVYDSEQDRVRGMTVQTSSTATITVDRPLSPTNSTHTLEYPVNYAMIPVYSANFDRGFYYVAWPPRNDGSSVEMISGQDMNSVHGNENK